MAVQHLALLLDREVGVNDDGILHLFNVKPNELNHVSPLDLQDDLSHVLFNTGTSTKMEELKSKLYKTDAQIIKVRFGDTLSNSYLTRLFLDVYYLHPLSQTQACEIAVSVIPKYPRNQANFKNIPKNRVALALIPDQSENINYHTGQVSSNKRAKTEYHKLALSKPELLYKLEAEINQLSQVNHWQKMLKFRQANSGSVIGTSPELTDFFIGSNLNMNPSDRPKTRILHYQGIRDHPEFLSPLFLQKILIHVDHTTKLLHQIVTWDLDGIVKDLLQLDLVDSDGPQNVKRPRIYDSESIVLYIRKLLLFTSSFLMVTYSDYTKSNGEVDHVVHAYLLGTFYETILPGVSKRTNLYIGYQSTNDYQLRTKVLELNLRSHFYNRKMFTNVADNWIQANIKHFFLQIGSVEEEEHKLSKLRDRYSSFIQPIGTGYYPVIGVFWGSDLIDSLDSPHINEAFIVVDTDEKTKLKKQLEQNSTYLALNQMYIACETGDQPGVFATSSSAVRNMTSGFMSYGVSTLPSSWRIIPLAFWLEGYHRLYCTTVSSDTLKKFNQSIPLMDYKAVVHDRIQLDENELQIQSVRLNFTRTPQIGSTNIHHINFLVSSMSLNSQRKDFLSHLVESTETVSSFGIDQLVVEGTNEKHLNLLLAHFDHVAGTSLFTLDLTKTQNHKNTLVTSIPYSCSYYPLPILDESATMPYRNLLIESSVKHNTGPEHVKLTMRELTGTRFKAHHIPWFSYLEITEDLNQRATSAKHSGAYLQVDLMYQTVCLHDQYIAQLDNLLPKYYHIQKNHSESITEFQNWMLWSSGLLLKLVSRIGNEDLVTGYFDDERGFRKFNIFNITNALAQHPLYDITIGSNWTFPRFKHELGLTFSKTQRTFEAFLDDWMTIHPIFRVKKMDQKLTDYRRSSVWNVTEPQSETFTTLVLRLFTLVETLVKVLDMDLVLPIHQANPLNVNDLYVVLTAYSMARVFIDYVCFSIVNPKTVLSSEQIQNAQVIYNVKKGTITLPQMGNSILAITPPNTTKRVWEVYSWPVTISEVIASTLHFDLGFNTTSYFTQRRIEELVNVIPSEVYLSFYCKRFRKTNYYIESDTSNVDWIWNTLCNHGSLSPNSSLKFADGLTLLLRAYYGESENFFFSPFYFRYIEPKLGEEYLTLSRFGQQLPATDPIFKALVQVGLDNNFEVFVRRFQSTPISRRDRTFLVEVLLSTVFAKLCAFNGSVLVDPIWDVSLITKKPIWLSDFLARRLETKLLTIFREPSSVTQLSLVPNGRRYMIKGHTQKSGIGSRIGMTISGIWHSLDPILHTVGVFRKDYEDEEFKTKIEQFLQSTKTKETYLGSPLLLNPNHLSLRYIDSTIREITANITRKNTTKENTRQEVEWFKFYRTCLWDMMSTHYRVRLKYTSESLKDMQEEFDQKTLLFVRGYSS